MIFIEESSGIRRVDNFWSYMHSEIISDGIRAGHYERVQGGIRLGIPGYISERFLKGFKMKLIDIFLEKNKEEFWRSVVLIGVWHAADTPFVVCVT